VPDTCQVRLAFDSPGIPAMLHHDDECPPKAGWTPSLDYPKITIVTRIHLKRMESDYLALCGIRPRESFKLIDSVSKFTHQETDLACKICLKAALGLKAEQYSNERKLTLTFNSRAH
jgi:hypothetical protein